MRKDNKNSSVSILIYQQIEQKEHFSLMIDNISLTKTL